MGEILFIFTFLSPIIFVRTLLILHSLIVNIELKDQLYKDKKINHSACKWNDLFLNYP